MSILTRLRRQAESNCKRRAAEDGLKALSTERKQLQTDKDDLVRQQQQFHQWQQEQHEKLTAAPPSNDGREVKSDPPAGDQNEDLAKQYREAMYDGEEAKADKIMAQMMAGRAQTATPQEIDLDKIRNDAANIATQRLEQKQLNNSIADAQTFFGKEYKDIKDDPELFAMADNKTGQVSQENPTWTPKEVAAEVGDQVRAWRDKLTGATSQSTEQKLAAKRSMASPRAGTGRVQAKPEPKRQTNSEYVQGLIEQRMNG